MDRNGQARKEPSLADLEAFEKLLRESLQAEAPKSTAPTLESVAADPAESLLLTEEPLVPESSAPSPRRDQAAMAELARLIEAPLEFAPPHRPQPAQGPFAEGPPAEAHLHGHAEAQLQPQWMPEPRVETHFSQTPAIETEIAKPVDPLAAFEEELRRFDAIRGKPASIEPDASLRPAYPGETQSGGYHEVYADGFGAVAPESTQSLRVEPSFDSHHPVQSTASPLDVAEGRLAAEAAAAAAVAGGTVANPGRSRGLFVVLGGVAAAGLAVIAGSLFFGSGEKKAANGDVPVIAAKPQPTKEKPADPGGMEIPNQNKQVLAPRGANDTKPAQVVSNTEQPLDLNQATRRDGVRVIAPSPYQNTNPPGATSAEANSGSGLVEPRRVTSIRIPSAGPEAVIPAGGPQTPPSVSAPGVATGAPGIAVPGAPAGTPRPTTSVPNLAIPPAVPSVPKQDSALPPPKVETRPVAATPPKAEPPKVTPPSGIAPSQPAQPKAPPRQQANAPLSLTNPGSANPAAPAATTRPAPVGGGGYAVQLASRPTEDDARNASNQLRTRFASALGGRAVGVVSGEANGQTVYRVRAGGFSQAEAVEACNKVKAAGGGCFVTKQ